MNELFDITALELAAMIRRREVSSREVVAAHLARIEQVNPAINAVTVVLADEAMAAAAAADATEPVGALHGVPITVKENIDVAGSATTEALAAFADNVASVDAAIVARLRAAGAIPIGRTNLPEVGLRSDTSNAFRGRTANPWNLALTPGGSSGGEGAAIASRMSPLGLGNDIGGSLRSPAYCNGIVGLRPTMHRVPTTSTQPPFDGPLCGQMMATDGPMARSVADVSLALALLNGADPNDPLSVDVAIDRGPITRRVAAIASNSFDGPNDPAVIQGLRRAADALTADGWEIEEIELPEFRQVFDVWNRLMADDLHGLLAALGPLLDPRLVENLTGHITAADAHGMPPGGAFIERRRLMRVWTEMFARYPVVVTPVFPDPPRPSDTDLTEGFPFLVRVLQYLTPAPLLGLPALALPTGLIDGIPTGVQIHADRWNDAWCIQAGAAVERQLGTLPIPTGL